MLEYSSLVWRPIQAAMFCGFGNVAFLIFPRRCLHVFPCSWAFGVGLDLPFLFPSFRLGFVHAPWSVPNNTDCRTIFGYQGTAFNTACPPHFFSRFFPLAFLVFTLCLHRDFCCYGRFLALFALVAHPLLRFVMVDSARFLKCGQVVFTSTLDDDVAGVTAFPWFPLSRIGAPLGRFPTV